MGKTFEALERAKQEASENLSDGSRDGPEREIEPLTEKAKQKNWDDIPGILKEPKDREIAASAELVSHPMAIESCHELRTNLEARLRDKTIRSILFVGTSPGDGSSTVAFNYATLLSEDSEQRILLLDLDGDSPVPYEGSEKDCSHVPAADDSGKDQGLFRIKKMGPGDLYALIFGEDHVNYDAFFESDRIDRFLALAYKRFDCLIMAAPSISGSSKARAFCGKVDGIVMVILSGKTRRQIAIKTKEVVEDTRGKLIGVVLNRRKYYIPKSIYKRL